ncbi:Peptidoglycan/xylan/chitin deacetylase, PgdA/CDA1 family [Paenibacillus sp. cl141a]|uniref:polysaccharide deacetylase family protein n=1 Tax=Paenibacillus sp. cl141a TaxID=1761877 RepID=UPI0008BAFE5A|nr:polysaccharide deacetylase family protein [Paenibacillus sp. cl141a]SEL85407.1 Peptidoglycan/xylan/chitin deacetylase, PgdA/CDA1 family [Paenibacillus sp. cl141a]
MVRTRTVLLLACCLMLSACGSNGAAQKQGAAMEGGTTQTTQINESAGQVSPPKENTDPSAEQGKPEDPSSTSSSESPDSPDPSEEAVKDPESEAPSEPKYHMNKVYRIVPNDESVPEKVVLLTFDDGPKDEKMINRMIDTLDKHKAKAIFFVNGYRAKEHPELLKLIHDRGQIIGNHSWDHIDLKKESKQKVEKQIGDVQEIVKEATGAEPKFFRPPFGSGGDTVKEVALEHDLLFMTWSNGSLDWESKNKNKPDAVVSNVLEQLHPGSNILMHELPWTVEALDSLLTKLEDKGYGFVDPQWIEPKIR